MIDFGRGQIIPYAELFEEMMELIRDDAEALGCVKEVDHARKIVAHGTSAHRQIAVYKKSLAEGKTKEDALGAVVDMVIEDTMHGI